LTFFPSSFGHPAPLKGAPSPNLIPRPNRQSAFPSDHVNASTFPDTNIIPDAPRVSPRVASRIVPRAHPGHFEWHWGAGQSPDPPRRSA
jgi:hypothetical protein